MLAWLSVFGLVGVRLAGLGLAGLGLWVLGVVLGVGCRWTENEDGAVVPFEPCKP